MMDFRDNMLKCQQYVNALEDERKKIQVFQRELPLCLELVTQAIEACKQQLCGITTTTECFNGHSECSEQTSDGPVFEEFMPLKRSNSQDDDEEEEEFESNKPHNNNNNNEKSGKKSDWLRSVQLWNQNPDPLTTQEDRQPKKVPVVEVKRTGNGGAFHPFQKENKTIGDVKINNNNNDNSENNNNKKKPASTAAASACSTAHDGDAPPTGGGKKVDKDEHSQRKTRRCWSPELHRRFVHALQQLGGSHVATPKQIRELMKVDGLTNDEVKSHLQKYRLHTRRPTSSAVHNNANQQTAQFVVVGGIWVPPPEYAAMPAVTTAGDTTTSMAPPSGIYTPIATVAPPPALHQTPTDRPHTKQLSHSHCEERPSHSEGGVNSPTTSSSTHTSTGSHAY